LHRDVFAALTDAEFDPVSSEESAERFGQLASKTDAALAAARDAKDAINGSFDVLIARTEHRTSEIIKVLTEASILLLPGALIAGVMGMNVNFKASTFAHSPIFLGAVLAILLVAGATVGVARSRRWI
jgi:Mg2+ and Co2+ transporter CorA